MKELLRNIAIGIVAVIFFFIVIINVAKGFDDPYNTVVVKRYSEYNKVTVEGIAIREEVIINEEYNGYLMYHYENGEKVSKGLPIATVYDSKVEASNQAKINKLEKEMNILIEAENPGTTVHANAEVLAKQVSEKTKESINSVDSSDFKKASNLKLELIELLCTNNIVLKVESGYSRRIEELSQEISKIRTSVSEGVLKINSPEEGEFISFTDGYENFITYEEAENLDVESLDTIIKVAKRKTEKNSNAIGKIISGYEWYFAVIVPNEVVRAIDVGKKLKLRYNFNQSVTISAEISSINFEKDRESSVVIFKSADTHPMVLSMRAKSVDLIFGIYEGIKIPKSAVRFRDITVKDDKTQKETLDKEMGVYALIGIEPKFRKIDVLYETDEYIISSLKTDPGDYKRYVQPEDIVLIDNQK